MTSLKTNTKIVTSLVFLLAFLFLPSNINVVEALTLKSIKDVFISASIGENRVTIFGYCSPNSKVELSSVSVFDVTLSDSQGNFIFDRTFLPLNPSDLCLSFIDAEGRRSQPVCIPPPPPANYHTDIGPILLPPTLSLDSEIINPNSTTLASGQSIPDSQIDIYFYQSDSQAPIFPVKDALAVALPIFSTHTDSLGNYSFNLPTTYSSDFRLYATTLLVDFPSPKSNTLAFSLPSLWSIFWAQNGWLVATLAALVFTLTLLFYLIILARRQTAISSLQYPPAKYSFPLVTLNYFSKNH